MGGEDRGPYGPFMERVDVRETIATVSVQGRLRPLPGGGARAEEPVGAGSRAAFYAALATAATIGLFVTYKFIEMMVLYVQESNFLG